MTRLLALLLVAAPAVAIAQGVAPNHGWRHRFKTRNAGWDTSSHTRRHTGTGSGQGQASARVADTYGDVTLRIQVDAIAKLPWIEVMSLP